MILLVLVNLLCVVKLANNVDLINQVSFMNLVNFVNLATLMDLFMVVAMCVQIELAHPMSSYPGIRHITSYHCSHPNSPFLP